MKGVLDYAVAYDITSNEERREVDRILKGFGFRVQKSVFECRMTKKDKLELIQKLESENIQTGFIKIYRLEYSWKSRIIGKSSKSDVDDKNAFIV